MGLAKSVQEAMAATLSNLGFPVPAKIVQTMLLKDGYFAGYEFRKCSHPGDVFLGN